jgi:hypothetical protein
MAVGAVKPSQAKSIVQALRDWSTFTATTNSASTANVTYATSSPSATPRFRTRSVHRLPFAFPTTKPMFVISMGWHRWGPQARRKWVIELLNASTATANLCREWLAADRREHERDPHGAP